MDGKYAGDVWSTWDSVFENAAVFVVTGLLVRGYFTLNSLQSPCLLVLWQRRFMTTYIAAYDETSFYS